MGKPKISAEVTREEMEAYRAEATRMGLTLSEWMRRALNSSLPKAPPRPAVAEVAFAHLDAVSSQPGMTALLEGPVPTKPSSPVSVEAQPDFPKLPTTPPASLAHPCIYLRAGPPGVLTGGEAQGTCDHGSQRGKPCFWAAQLAARNCGVFAPKLDLRAKPLPQQRFRR